MTEKPDSPSPTAQTSPITSVNPELSTLFARDPLNLTTNDIQQMVNYFREHREKWQTATAKRKQAKEMSPVDRNSMTLAELKTAAKDGTI